MVQTRSFTLAAASIAAFAGLTHGAGLEEWRSRSIYQVMVDRFARTDGSTDAPCVLYEFCNGTWAGLINKLDYIQGMGFTAIQISPVVKNMDQDTSVGEAYHGYWSQDDYAVNPHFGTADELKKLADELHKRDMFFMVDVVVNNFAQAFNNTLPPPVDYSKFNPLNDQKYFHKYCNVTEWDNPTNYQDCWLYPYGVALADVDTDSDEVVTILSSWVKELVSNYSIDGIRIDAAKHVNDAFLPQFVSASGVFAMGEVLTGVTDDMCRYQSKGLLPGMPNYLEYFPLQTVFNGHSMWELATARSNAQAGCNDTTVLGNFAENHDVPRFAAAIEDITLAKNAMTYILMNDGIPTVYQGQEQHFNGNSTPFNREPLWQSKYDTTAPLYNLTSQLNKLRNLAIKQSPEYVSSVADQIFVDVNHLCLAKGKQGNKIVFCINNKSSQGDSYELPVGGFAANEEVVEVLTCTTTTASSAGNVTAFMGAGEPKVFYPAAALNGSGICPTTTVAKPNAASVAAALSTLGATIVLASMAWLL
ncbi:Alpha-amylase-like protein [Coniochaeta hoffmannii]|uniref:alpha-amylase n=1 Tax=Coniochaeta hoffmannii TaxID=91930 RepID=A0AA38RF29_9PEZI|nr:Alpha-amylase-like protein [Coniochaeta hoffmannii]